MAEGYYYSIELHGGKDIMKKRLFVVILCCALLVANLLGCGGTDGDVVSSKSQTISADDSLWEKSPSEIKDFFSDKYICFGTYPQNKKKAEPIDWIVIDVDDEKQLYLLSLNVLEVLQYDSTEPSNATWKDSELRAFLNDSFYNEAFNDDEKARIVDSEVINDINDHGLSGGENTVDKVFIPSVDEIISYVPIYNWNGDFGYAETVFLQTNKTDHAVTYKDPETGKKNERSSLEWEIWWLRLPVDDVSKVSVVSTGPNCRVGNMDSPATDFQGVRPAVKIGPGEVTYKQNEYYDSLVEKHNTRREKSEKANRYISSNLYLSFQEYYGEVVRSVAPDKEFDYSVNTQTDYSSLSEEDFDTYIDSRETALKYFTTSAVLYVDYETAEIEPKVFIDALIKAGISGSLCCINGYDEDGIVDWWIINAHDGTVERYQSPGV
jgi:hypothetical protein